MTEPIFDPVTERMYDRLPEFVRNEDVDFNYKKYISLSGRQISSLYDLIDRLDVSEDPEETADLVDPTQAEQEWLPWLAQLMGSGLKQGATRESLVAAAQGYHAGTNEALAAAVRGSLAGDQFIRVNPLPGGSFWDIQITTRISETLVNLVPEWLATTSTPKSFSSDNAAVKVESVEAPGFYEDRALQVTYSGEGMAEATLRMNSQFSVYEGDPLTYMYSATGNGLAITPYIYFYDASGGFVGLTLGPFETPDETVKQYGGVVSQVPATAATAVMAFKIENITNEHQIRIGMFGARREPETEWVPRTADPVQLITELGAKPAGFVLHHDTVVTTWASVEANYPTMGDLDNTTWGEIEESSI